MGFRFYSAGAILASWINWYGRQLNAIWRTIFGLVASLALIVYLMGGLMLNLEFFRRHFRSGSGPYENLFLFGGSVGLILSVTIMWWFVFRGLSVGNSIRRNSVHNQ
jgi:hypothetical protein